MVPAPMKWVSGILIGIGLAAFIVALTRGSSADAATVLAVNQSLMGMVAAVSFLQLITPKESSAQPRLTGRAAVWRTTGAVHLLGSVINITSVSTAGDRIRGSGKLQKSDALLLSRAFSAGAFWSPFWAASAAALTYAPEAQLSIVFVCGAALAFVSLAFSSETIARRMGDRLPAYQGYALTRQLLQVPVTMVVLIIVLHLLAPDVPVAKLVLVCSVGITAAVLLKRNVRRAPRTFLRHAAQNVPRHYSELTLFAAAGILAVGLRAFLSVTPVSLPFGSFGVLEAWLCIILIIGFSLLGAHPLVSIAALAALTAQMNPEPTLFALAAVIGWGCASATGPMSGLLIFLHGRYGMNSLTVVRGNLAYIAFVVAMAYPALLLCQALV